MSKFEAKVKDYIKDHIYGTIIYSTGVKYSTTGQAYAVVMNQVVWYAVRLIVEIDPRAIKPMVIKMSEFYLQDNGKKFIESIVDNLSNSSPPRIKEMKDKENNNLKELDRLCFLSIPKEVRDNPEKYLRPGDFVMANRGKYDHAGIYIGNNEIIHFTGPDSTDNFKKVSKIMKTNWSQFIGDKTQKYISVFLNVLKFKNAQNVVEKAKELIGTEEGEYNLFKNNCQHFGNLCLNDEKVCTEFSELKFALLNIFYGYHKTRTGHETRLYFECYFD